MVLLVQLFKKRFALSLVAIFTSLLFVAATLWWNLHLSRIIDIISRGDTLSADIIILALIIILIICGVSYIKTYIFGFTCEILTHDLRMGYAEYYSSLSILEIETLSLGEEISKLQNEIADVSGYLNGNFIQLTNNIINFIATLGWLLIINARLTLAINLPVLAIMIYVFYASKVIGNATNISQQTKGRMNRHTDTLFTMFPIIKLYDSSYMVVMNYKREVGEWENQTIKAERIRARLMSLSGLMKGIPFMLLLFIGGGMVINGSLTLGTLYIFINLSENVSGVMMNMPGFMAAFRQFSVNMKRLSAKIILVDRSVSI